MQPHRRQPPRIHHPWDSPGKNTGVGCHCLLRETWQPSTKIVVSHLMELMRVLWHGGKRKNQGEQWVMTAGHGRGGWGARNFLGWNRKVFLFISITAACWSEMLSSGEGVNYCSSQRRNNNNSVLEREDCLYVQPRPRNTGSLAVNPENPSGSCLTRKKENIHGCYFWGQVDRRRWEWYVMHWMLMSPQNLYAKSLIPKVMVYWDRAFGW